MIKKDIELTRGDTLAFNVTISEIDGVTVESMYFSCRKKYGDETYIFQKKIGDGITMLEPLKYRVRVAPEDTWQMLAGKYVYDLQIGLGADIYTPLIGNFKLIWDVTEELE